MLTNPDNLSTSLMLRAHLLANDSHIQILLLLMQSTRLTAFELCQKLYISESLLYKKIAQLRKCLAPYSLTINKRAGRYHIGGNTFQSMAYFLKFFRTGLNHQIWPFTNSSQSVITASLHYFIDAEKIKLTAAQLTNYVFLIGFLRCQSDYVKEQTERSLPTLNKIINQQLLTYFDSNRLKSLVAQLQFSQTDLNLFLCYSQTRDDFYMIKIFKTVALNQHQLANSEAYQLTRIFKEHFLSRAPYPQSPAESVALPSLLAVNYAFTLAEHFDISFALLAKNHAPHQPPPLKVVDQIDQTIQKFGLFKKRRLSHNLIEQLINQYQALLTHFFNIIPTLRCFTVSLFGYDSYQEAHIVQTLIEQRFQTLFTFIFIDEPPKNQPIDFLFFAPGHEPPSGQYSAIPVTKQVDFQDCQRIHDTLIKAP